MRPQAIAAIPLLAALPLLAACNTGTTQDKTVGSQTTSPAAAQTPATTVPPGVGTTLTTGDAHVTLVKLIDPATSSNQYDTPETGDRFVAAEFTIANVGKKVIDDDANNDASLQGSNGQTYSPSFDSITGCTNFDSGRFTLTPGQSTTGCVAFQVPTGVTITGAQFQMMSGLSSYVGQWKVG